MKYCILVWLLNAFARLVLAQEIKPAATEDWSNKPPVITPGKAGAAPSDAVVLFADKNDLSKWQRMDGTAATWEVTNDVLRIVKDAGDIETKQKFGNIQLHLEWMTPDAAEDESTSRGNSGVLFMGLYELQIYESYQYKTKMYYNGIAGSIYKQYAPLVNASLPPQTWQTYDVIFEAPVFNADKTLKRPAMITVLLNGVLIQNHIPLKGPMVYAGHPDYRYHAPELPLRLQEHDSRVSFRNIWIRKLPLEN
jgi:hypothetical protein